MTPEPTLSTLLRSVHRLGHEPPPVISQLGWRFHHVGIPTDQPLQDETHLAAFGVHISGFDSSPFGVEGTRYAANSPLHPAIKTVPHVAFDSGEWSARRADLIS